MKKKILITKPGKRVVIIALNYLDSITPLNSIVLHLVRCEFHIDKVESHIVNISRSLKINANICERKMIAWKQQTHLFQEYQVILKYTNQNDPWDSSFIWIICPITLVVWLMKKIEIVSEWSFPWEMKKNSYKRTIVSVDVF